MTIDNMGLVFPPEYLRAALLVSLLSVWVLVGLFHHLNRYTKREDFSIWTGAWLFYAIWLTSSFGLSGGAPGSVLFTINQTCVAISAILLLWGSLRCLGIPVPRRLAGVLALFLAGWVWVSPQMKVGALQIHLPVFILLGLSSPFAGVCLLRLRKQKQYAGVGMLFLGFLMWVIYIGSYPMPREYGNLFNTGFLIAAALHVFMAGCMVYLLVGEVRREASQVRAEIEAVRLEHSKVLTTKEACLSLYHQMRSAEETEKALAELQRARQVVVEREHLQALGQMAGDVAHDINNALSPISAYSELLLTTLPNLPDIPRQRLQRISQAAEEVAQLVAHMREFYRASELKMPADNAVAVKTAAGRAGEQRRPLRILCIDDEPNLRELLQDVLELDHHQVTVAPGGREGLDLFRASLHAGDPFEVVITDLGMPEIDGNHVARVIKSESPQTPVIMLTGWGALSQADGQSASPVDAVLGKPPRRQELSDLLVQVTERPATQTN